MLLCEIQNISDEPVEDFYYVIIMETSDVTHTVRLLEDDNKIFHSVEMGEIELCVVDNEILIFCIDEIIAEEISEIIEMNIY